MSRAVRNPRLGGLGLDARQLSEVADVLAADGDEHLAAIVRKERARRYGATRKPSPGDPNARLA